MRWSSCSTLGSGREREAAGRVLRASGAPATILSVTLRSAGAQQSDSARMNFSIAWRAVESSYCSGGDFMR